MKTSYKRLLPGSTKHGAQSSKVGSADGTQGSPATCSVNLIACDTCRRKKAKCDGQRPICDRCSRCGSHCNYDAEVGESRSAALKKKYRALVRDYNRLAKEAHMLRRFYGHIRAAPEEQAFSVFQKIRASRSSRPLDVLESLDETHQERTEYLASYGDSDGENNEPESDQNIEVRAAPWTTVAGDEVVSELITQYFTFDYLYVFPPINRAIFAREMASPSIHPGLCCSQLLVNAICAQQCYISRREHMEGIPRLEMAERFLEEANRLLPHELHNLSLPTCQAACLIFAAAAARDQLNDGDS
ncbi:hypothetical protein E4U30_005955 [Claviceps sp. LM220 group G6]|nr:hypothetical protein E4U15_006267 [Claviceps sp. LM218 group G6]KAG6098253.1 hypothetical protein E4U31_004780 [Claviceps sp. LM219 group G6]KAG6102478.1 hypothetical protein E4U30_005955 [Claviceps sp. LM220 group G6]KAG6118690.1 hypothetical protein E4U14_006414 [Claviceps sp. LM454 group G7]